MIPKSKAQLVLPAAVLILSALICLCFGGINSAIAESDGTKALTTLAHTIPYDSARPANAESPYFSHGFLIELVHYAHGQGSPNIYLSDKNGHLEHTLSIWPDGAVKLFLSSASVGTNEKLVFAGRVTREDGSVSAFIATSDLEGHDPRYFDTGTYTATKVTVANDGSIWAVGADRAEELGDVKKLTNYDTVRHFSSQGLVVGHYLPRWGESVKYIEVTSVDSRRTVRGFDADGNSVAIPHAEAAWGYRDAWKPSRQVFLISSSNKTILYDGLHGDLCRYSLRRGSFACKPVTQDPKWIESRFVTGVVVLDGGSIFASMKGGEFDSETPQRGLFVLVHSSTNPKVRWELVPGTGTGESSTSPFLYLVGSDSNTLLYRQRQSKKDQRVIYEATW